MAQRISTIIKLDVGGTIFKTSLSTLTRYEGSMFAAMFSGRHPLVPDENGCYFIDRDPEPFRYILEFLRCGSEPMPVEIPAEDMRVVLREAEFYGLRSIMEKSVVCKAKRTANDGQFVRMCQQRVPLFLY